MCRVCGVFIQLLQRSLAERSTFKRQQSAFIYLYPQKGERMAALTHNQYQTAVLYSNIRNLFFIIIIKSISQCSLVPGLFFLTFLRHFFEEHPINLLKNMRK